MIMILCLSAPAAVFARGTEKLKVGMIVAERFTKINDGGYYSGYGYEYLHEIAKYTGWEYQYIWGTSKSNLQKLSEGKIDLFGPMIKTPETEEMFAFPDYDCGTSYTTLCVDSENHEAFGYNNLKNIDGKKIGMFTDMPENKPFLEYCESLGLTVYPEYYESYVDLVTALNEKEIEIILSTTIQEIRGTQTIAKILPKPFYFVTTKENTAILAKLNSALKNIELVTPQLEAKLYDKYYSARKDNVLSLSEDELRYIKNHPVVRVAHDPDHFPVEAYNRSANSCSGITYEIFRKISDDTGLKFDYIPTESFAEALTVISDGKADIICGINDDYNVADKHNLYLAEPYLDMDFVLVKHNKLFQKEKLTIAVPEGHQIVNRYYILSTYPGAKVDYYKSFRECILAVHDEKADITFADRYTVEEVQKEPSVNNLVVVNMPDFNYQLTAGIRKNLDPTLMVIINKAINNISKEELNDIITKCTGSTDETVTFSTLIYRNPFQAILIIISFFAVVLIVIAQLIRLRRKHAVQVEKLAYYDSATGCWNSNKFNKEAQNLLSKNHNTTFAVCIFDIKKFKFINESYGHSFGDEVLRQIARNLEKFKLDDMYFAHKTADKFNLIFPADSEENASEIIGNLFRHIQSCTIRGVPLKLSFDCGVYLVKHGEGDIDKAIDKADYARKSIKNSPTERTCFFNVKMEKVLRTEKEIEEKMQHSLNSGEFKVYFQPKFDMSRQRIVGAEALVRWNSRDRGFLRPDEFVPILEKNGFIVNLDFYVLEEVCKLISSWIEEGKNPISISVNQSRKHFSYPQYISKLSELIEKYNIPPHLIELELTESSFLDNNNIIPVMDQMRNLGFILSMDDFGSGFSSLNLLREIPIDVLKLDKGFLEETTNSKRTQIIIQQIIEMARRLNISVICEGVETEEQAQFLLSVGCHLAQGYYYFKPMPEQDFLREVEEELN